MHEVQLFFLGVFLCVCVLYLSGCLAGHHFICLLDTGAVVMRQKKIRSFLITVTFSASPCVFFLKLFYAKPRTNIKACLLISLMCSADVVTEFAFSVREVTEGFNPVYPITGLSGVNIYHQSGRDVAETRNAPVVELAH